MATEPDAFHQHDHQACIHTALESAHSICKERGARLTTIRARVLELVWQSHQPLGAYQLLNQLSSEGFNSAPPTVYRALDFLQEQGLVHRIASLNAFIGCNCPGERHQGYFLICRQCGAAQELESEQVTTFLHSSAVSKGFQIEEEIVELSGLCPQCQTGNKLEENS